MVVKKSRFVFLVLVVGVAISEMSAEPPETAINQPAPAATNNVRIVGGQEAEPGEFPHQLFMEIRDKKTDTWKFICGAFILNSRWALTAAHCVYGFKRNPELFKLHAGHLSRSKPITGHEKSYKVVRIRDHPGYKYGPDGRVVNDIALIKIKNKFKFSKKMVKSAELMETPEPIIGKTAAVSGWGMMHYSGSWNDSAPDSDILQKAELLVLPSHSCKKWFGATLFDPVTQICARGMKQGACRGDSGGPLEIKGTVVGITSFVHPWGCGNDYPEVYTRVSAYSDWIQEVTSFA